VTDSDGRIASLNPFAERMTGWREDEARGHPLTEVVRMRHSTDGRDVEDPVGGVLCRHEFALLPPDLVLVGRDGSEHGVSGCASPVSHGDEKAGVKLMLLDMTQAHRDRMWLAFMHDAGLSLAGSLDYQTTLTRVARIAVESLADVCVVDVVQSDGRIRRLAAALGDPKRQAILSATMARGVDPRVDPASCMDMLARGEPASVVAHVIRTGRPFVALDILGEHPRFIGGSSDPQVFAICRAAGMRSAMIVPLIATERAIGSIMWVSRDPERFQPSEVEYARQLTHMFALALENARLYREARDALAMREEFISIASHELRTPLTSLQLQLATLQKAHRAASDNELLLKLQRVKEQADRLAGLSESLLDVARLAVDRMDMSPIECDLRLVVGGAVDRAAPEARRAGCAVTFASGPSVVGRFDERRIAQAVGILISNALKFGAGRPVDVSLSTGEGMVRIAVKDQGIGIAREDVPRIFDRFERAVSSRHYGGLGIGLYVAREIAEAHRGSIAVAAEPEAGSTFEIVLPLQPAATGGA
jgi:PAS domain S-box-containing protein